jgi:hypothetical protein
MYGGIVQQKRKNHMSDINQTGQVSLTGYSEPLTVLHQAQSQSSNGAIKGKVWFTDSNGELASVPPFKDGSFSFKTTVGTKPQAQVERTEMVIRLYHAIPEAEGVINEKPFTDVSISVAGLNSSPIASTGNAALWDVVRAIATSGFPAEAFAGESQPL